MGKFFLKLGPIGGMTGNFEKIAIFFLYQAYNIKISDFLPDNSVFIDSINRFIGFFTCKKLLVGVDIAKCFG